MRSRTHTHSDFGFVFLRLHRQFHEVLHEHAERNIVRVHGATTAAVMIVVRHARIQLGQEEASFTLVLIAHNVARDGKAGVHDTDPSLSLSRGSSTAVFAATLCMATVLVASVRRYRRRRNYNAID
jgi:hypothetical protein